MDCPTGTGRPIKKVKKKVKKEKVEKTTRDHDEHQDSAEPKNSATGSHSGKASRVSQNTQSPATGNEGVRAGVLTGKDPKDKFNLGFDLYDESQNYSVEYLFGGLDGAPLVDAILEWFVQEEVPHLPWFFTDSSGSTCRTIVRSPLSRKIQERTVARYKARIFAEGLSQRVAGTGMAVGIVGGFSFFKGFK